MEERSAGAILFNQNGGSRRYLLLMNAGRWDFPKGNIEKGESDEQTVFREVREETGLSEIVLIDGFRRVIEYFYRRGSAAIHKRVVFLLASTEADAVKISSEHQDFGWFTYRDALVRTTHDNSKKLLVEAESFVTKMEGSPAPQNSELN
jgi:bis(5'-nucleosidyl)-tetraphosphatase